MLNESEIRHRKHELMNAIDYANEDISRKLKDIEEVKERIKGYQAGLREINMVLKDE